MRKSIKRFLILLLILVIFGGCGQREREKVIIKDTLEIGRSDFTAPIYPNSFYCNMSKEIRAVTMYLKNKKRCNPETHITCKAEIGTNDAFDKVRDFYASKISNNVEIIENIKNTYVFIYRNPNNERVKTAKHTEYVEGKIFSEGDYAVRVSQWVDHVKICITEKKSIMPGEANLPSDLFYLKVKNYPSKGYYESVSKIKSVTGSGYISYKGKYMASTKDSFNKVKKYYLTRLKKICNESLKEEYETFNAPDGVSHKRYRVYGFDKESTRYCLDISVPRSYRGSTSFSYEVETR